LVVKAMTDRREQGKARQLAHAHTGPCLFGFDGHEYHNVDCTDLTEAIESAVAEAGKIERAVWEREFMLYAEVKRDTAECANKLAEHRNKIFESLCRERVAEALAKAAEIAGRHAFDEMESMDAASEILALGKAPLVSEEARGKEKADAGN
jgi:hypothetical protein